MTWWLVLACGPSAPVETPAPAETPAPERASHTVDVDGHPFAVWSRHPADADAVVLLVHGRTWSTLPDFDLQAPEEELSLMEGLAEAGIGAYGVDLRGYGGTPRDASGWLTPVRAADDVAGVLAWLRERHPGLPVHLFGWSNGARVAQLVAQRHPEHVDRLVLFGLPHRIEPIAVDLTDGEPPRVPTTAEAARSDFIVPGSIRASSVQAYVDAALASDPVRADWRAWHEWNALDPVAVTVPTLLLQGAHDPYVDPAAHAALFGRMGTDDRVWVVIPGGDHAAFLEAPRDRFLGALEGFLRSPGGTR